MKKFMDEDFLLTSDAAKKIFIMIMQRTCRL